MRDSLKIWLCFLVLISAGRAEPNQSEILQLNEAISSGRYQEALVLGQRLRRECAASFGPTDERTVGVRLNLATAEQALGNYASAEQEYDECQLALGSSKDDATRKRHALILNLQSALYQTAGNYGRAEDCSRESVSIRTELLGATAPETLKSKTNLGAISWYLGNYESAITVLSEIVAARKKEDDPDKLGQALNNLGGVLKDAGRLDEAGKALLEGLALRQKATPDSLQTASSLQYVGEWQVLSGNHSGALRSLTETLKIRQMLLGERHAKIAETLTHLGAAMVGMGRLSEAQRVLSSSVSMIDDLLGRNHPDALRPVELLALCAHLENQPSEAKKYGVIAAEISAEALKKVLAFTSERERLGFLRRSRPFDLPATLENAEAVAASLSLWKGIVLDSILEERHLASTSAAVREKMAGLGKLKDHLRMLRAGHGDLASISQAEVRFQTAEKEIARQVAREHLSRTSLAVEPTQIRHALQPDTVLLDFIRYRKFGSGLQAIEHYGVLKLTANDTSFFDLGDAAMIDKQISDLRSVIQILPQGADEQAKNLCRQLNDTLLLPALSTRRPEHLILCPDGDLNFVPFGCLMTPDGHMLIEDARLSFFACARDVLKTSASVANKSALLFGSPDYQLPVSSNKTRRTHDDYRAALGTLRLASLPGTADEVKAIAGTLTRSGWNVSVNLENQASERAVRAVVAPGILHLATHGICETGTSTDLPPFFRAWLAFAGVNSASEQIMAGYSVAPESDGRLTAEEVVELSLEGTQLVTLSACDTGLGEVATGEGVFGLRRAFASAGAQNLIVTLWPISDAETVSFMNELYRRLADDESIQKAMHETQRSHLARYRVENGVARAVQWAGGFVLSASTSR